MTQSFYTAIGGMSAGQTKITVVADNIANMNTIGFKASKVNFSDVYYNTASTGQAPTGKLGGINPKQTGIGVKTASIARDFTAGTTLTTGLNTDLCINGSSFFTVASPTVEIMYTRDGNFKVDANGNLVTSSGYKVLGTDKSLNTTSSTTPIKIPTYISTFTTPGADGTKMLSDLNGISTGSVKSGTFTISAYAPDGTETAVEVTVSENMSVDGLVTAINDAFKSKNIDAEIAFEGGKLTVTNNDTNAVANIKFTNGTSNIVTQMGFSDINGDYQSEIINYQQTIGQGTPGDSTSQNYTSLSINENGIIEVKYGNNDTMSVMQDPDNPDKMIFKYTLNDGTIIVGNDLTINDSLVEPANFQIQFASFINPNGLTAAGNNVYTSGPNCGLALYGSISSAAFGNVQSGILEGSNVDLATEFADMVVAQRAIEANSRVFSTTNEILQTLTSLAR